MLVIFFFCLKRPKTFFILPVGIFFPAVWPNILKFSLWELTFFWSRPQVAIQETAVGGPNRWDWKNKPVANDFMEQILGGIKTTGLNTSSLTQSKSFFPSKGNLFVGQVIGNTHCNFLKVFHRSFLWRLQTRTWNINIKEAQRKMKHVTNWRLSLELLKSLIPHHPLP